MSDTVVELSELQVLLVTGVAWETAAPATVALMPASASFGVVMQLEQQLASEGDAHAPEYLRRAKQHVWSWSHIFFGFPFFESLVERHHRLWHSGPQYTVEIFERPELHIREKFQEWWSERDQQYKVQHFTGRRLIRCFDLEDCKDYCRTVYDNSHLEDLRFCERLVEVQFPWRTFRQ